jgi:signal transduction histidine kinase
MLLRIGSLVCVLSLMSVSVMAQPADGRKEPTWAQVSAAKKGTITALWDESTPFILKDSNGKLRGIEYDILQGFPKFLKETKGIDLTIQWKEAKDFQDLYSHIRDNSGLGTLGVSAFSITEKRQHDVDFTNPYMSDISVLITSENVPIMKNIDEFNHLIPRLTAVTIRETTYEQELIRLQTQGNLPFKFKYIPSNENVMKTLAVTDSAFGFIDLPVYMMLFNEDPAIKVKRQNLFPIKREGYAIILPENSDWAIPLKAYFENDKFKSELEKIISRYIDLDLYHFVEGLAVHSDDQVVMLLTKEKEIQYKDLLGKTQQVVDETRKRNFFIVVMSVTLIFLVVTAVQYRKRNEQNDQIEAQRKSIELKSVQLEQRNQHLLALDDEKNNLIKILAHDLRTPINQIQGLAQLVLLEKGALEAEQKKLINQIMDTSSRLNKMITHLLDIDALENNRVTVFMELVNLRKLSHQVVDSFEKQAQKKNIGISFVSLCESCEIKGDSLFLIQILENLISNAIKFSEKGKSVLVSLKESNGKVIVSVKDQGPGMSEEDLNNLFKKFQRLSARPTNGEDSFGIGLSIVKKYVELMNGRVWCESEPGNGSTFHVEFSVA